MAGGVPVMVTGVSVVYYWLAARYTSSWTRFVVCLLGAVGCSVAFHMFMKGFYFAQFVASLNTSALNY